MPNEIRRFLDFEEFTFDLTNNALLDGGKLVHLAPQALAVLRYLIEHRDRCISRKELLKEIWQGQAVDPNSVDQRIGEIREALKDNSRKIIQNRPRIGWQFVAAVTERTEVARALSVGASGSSSEPLATSVAQQDQAGANFPRFETVPTVKPAQNTLLWISLAAIVAAVATAILTLAVIRKPELRVLSSTQLTSDGREKGGPLLTDGRRIFFRERLGGSWQIASVPISGGESSSLNIPLTNPNLQDISRDGSTLLLQSYEGDVSKLWAYTISKGILLPVRAGFNHAAWAPDGRALAAETLDASSLLIYGAIWRRGLICPASLVDSRGHPLETDSDSRPWIRSRIHQQSGKSARRILAHIGSLGRARSTNSRTPLPGARTANTFSIRQAPIGIRTFGSCRRTWGYFPSVHRTRCA